MTLRARPVARRRGRAGWDSGDRRNSLINAGFFLAIGVSILLLVGYSAFRWYDDHFGAAATVDGQVITKDQLRNRLNIESFRLNYVESRIATLLAKERLTPSEAQGQIDFLNQRRSQLGALTLDRLVDVALMARLAADRGITVAETDIDAQLLEEATTSEQRHVWVIESHPATNPDTGEVGEAEQRAALVKAQQAFGRLTRGEPWEDVARELSDSGLAPQAGDLGWLPLESGYDEKIMAALFDVDLNEPTDIIEGDDDVYRIGRVTEVAAAVVDRGYEDLILDDKIVLADYRAAVRADVLRERLSERVVAEMSAPGLQRQVLEIYLPEPDSSTTGTEGGAKVRWIVFAPKDNMATADDTPADDPSWAKAKADAEAMHARLKANPQQFDALARTSSDESTGKANGGKQRWIYPTTPIDDVVRNAVLAEGLQPGQLLDPVQGDLGWYVIQFLRSNDETEDVYLTSVRSKITDVASFRQAARDNSEAGEAADGGDRGWIAMGELTDLLDDAVFATAIGQMSSVKTVANDGYYLYWIVAEETRQPTEEQIEIFEQTGFQYWYTKQKDDAQIDYALGTPTSA